MKIIVIIFNLLICFQIAQGQSSFAEIGSVWNYQYDWLGLQTIWQSTVVKDTMISGLTYNKIDLKCGDEKIFSNQFIALKNDSLFIYEEGKSIFFFRYNLQKGDTLVTSKKGTCSDSLSSFVVVNLETITIANKPVRQWTLKDARKTSVSQDHSIVFVEGIGSISYPITFYDISCIFDAAFFTLCSFKNSTIDHNFNCGALNTIQINANKFHLYPNPAMDNVNIVIHTEESSEASIKVYTYDGSLRIQLKNTLLSGVNVVPLDVTSLNMGIYFVEVATKNFSFIKKIIKAQ